MILYDDNHEDVHYQCDDQFADDGIIEGEISC